VVKQSFNPQSTVSPWALWWTLEQYAWHGKKW